MQLDGIGDPLNGNGGFSYVRLPIKQLQNVMEEQAAKFLSANKNVTGTDADLRKLNMQQTKEKLLTYGFKAEKIDTLTRWERVSLLRYMSSQAAQKGEEGSQTKYARGVRLTTQEQKEKYQQKVNQIFQTQIEIFGKGELKDESSSEEEKAEVQTITQQNIKQTEQSLSDSSSKIGSEDEEAFDLFKKSLFQNEEQEETKVVQEEDQDILERKKLEELQTKGISGLQEETKQSVQKIIEQPQQKSLKIMKKKEGPDGKFIEQTEIITDPDEIKQILEKKEQKSNQKIKSSKKKYSTMNPQEAREQRKLLEQKKKLERDQQEREAMLQKLKQGEEIAKGQGQIICGRCGMPGHMQTNRKKCLMYVEEDDHQYLAEQSGYLKPVSATKFTINYENLPELPKKSMRPELISDYEKPKPKIKRSSRRQRALAGELVDRKYEDICDSLIAFDKTKIFIQPVKKEHVPQYFDIIKKPMDLGTMRQKSKRDEYQQVQSFLQDICQMANNAAEFNGNNHEIAKQSFRIRDKAFELLKEKNLATDEVINNFLQNQSSAK